MIDMHAHVLFGTDDGPDDIDTAVAMCRMAHADGTKRIYCTSHLSTDDGNVREILARRSEIRRELQARLDAENIGIELVNGAEWMLSAELIDEFPQHPESFLGSGKTFLFEISRFAQASFVPGFVQLATMDGFKPVFAHPERYNSIGPDNFKTILGQIVMYGGVLQLTAASLEGVFGPRPKEMAVAIAKAFPNNIILASDTHDTEVRVPGLSKGYALLDKINPGQAERSKKLLESILS